jgi:major vault protein
MVHGPCFFVPSVELEVVEKREAIPLDDNEGIYVRNNQTGHVRAVTGQTYMLKSCEELWEKPLAEEVSELLAFDYGAQDTSGASDNDYETQRVATKRDRTRVVTYRVPHNAVVQVYDYKRKAARMIFGPDLVLLQPDEQFTVLSLSGDKPKRPNVIKSLALMLGPDFMSDVIQGESMCDCLQRCDLVLVFIAAFTSFMVNRILCKYCLQSRRVTTRVSA